MYIGKGGGGLLIVSRCIVGSCQGQMQNIFFVNLGGDPQETLLLACSTSFFKQILHNL